MAALGRHLAQSELCKEDVLECGHSAAWGSFYDRTARRWGYGCCHGLTRGEHCPLALPAAAAAQQRARAASARDGESSDDEQHRPRAVDEAAAAVAVLAAAPELRLEPRPRAAFRATEEYLRHAISVWFHAWASTPFGNSGGPADACAVRATREALVPLLRHLSIRALDQVLLGRLADFIQLAEQREYSQANDAYLRITIGKSLWHNDMDLGEGRAHWGGGDGLRTWQRQTVEKDWKGATLFDSDPEVQRYVHALKRLVTYMQFVQPCEDPAKMGHAPAPPATAADGAGSCVISSIRDSDGTQNEPEWMDPAEASAAVTPSARGLRFGYESNGLRVPGSSRNNHPFASA